MADNTNKIMGAVGGAIALIVIVVALFAMTPTIIEQEEDVTFNASDTWNFTGASGAEALLGLTPFIWIGGIVIFVVAGTFLLAKSLGKA